MEKKKEFHLISFRSSFLFFSLQFVPFFQQSVKKIDNKNLFSASISDFVKIVVRATYVKTLILGANSSLITTADVVALNKHCSKSNFALTPGYLSSIVESPTCVNEKMIDL